MTLCLVNMVLIIMKGEKMKTEEQKFKDFAKFLGKKEFQKFQIRLAILLGIIMAEHNVDIKEAQEILTKQLSENH